MACVLLLSISQIFCNFHELFWLLFVSAGYHLNIFANSINSDLLRVIRREYSESVGSNFTEVIIFYMATLDTILKMQFGH